MRNERERGRGRDRAGMTVVEVLIAMVVFSVVMSGALGFLTVQNKAFHKGTDRMGVITSLRYVVETARSNVRTAGARIAADQPTIVYASGDVFAFTADYATNAQNDPWAVYYDPDAPTGQVTAPTSPVSIPGTSHQWPDSTFVGPGGVPAPAELITFRFVLDDGSARTDDYKLLRQVNGGAPDVVARDLLPPSDGSPFFSYVQLRTFPSAPSDVIGVPATDLPLTHHDAVADSLRGVRVSVRATNGLDGEHEREAEISALIHMPNAGLVKANTCGDEPILGVGFGAVASLDGVSGDPIVTLTWSDAVDEAGGEQDVMRYVIWRRDVSTGLPFADPLLSVPAGGADVYVDDTVESATTYQYRLGAQDCTPSLSETVDTDVVTTPALP